MLWCYPNSPLLLLLVPCRPRYLHPVPRDPTRLCSAWQQAGPSDQCSPRGRAENCDQVLRPAFGRRHAPSAALGRVATDPCGQAHCAGAQEVLMTGVSFSDVTVSSVLGMDELAT